MFIDKICKNITINHLYFGVDNTNYNTNYIQNQEILFDDQQYFDSQKNFLFLNELFLNYLFL